MTDEESKEVLKMIGGHVARLKEHFDSVQIFVSKYDGTKTGTRFWHDSDGCYLTGIGHISLWLEAEKEKERCKVRQDFGDAP